MDDDGCMDVVEWLRGLRWGNGESDDACGRVGGAIISAVAVSSV